MSHRDHFIGGQWIAGQGEEFRSLCPSTGNVVWSGTAAIESEVNRAVQAAQQAFGDWSQRPVAQRQQVLETFAAKVKDNASGLARLISREMGKPLWESMTEVNAVAGKVELTIQAFQERSDTTALEIPGGHAVTRYRPHGVLGVLGPFNLPAHLPNGHIVPALLLGNCVVFKPSDKTPAVAEMMVDLWNAAGLPEGVLNLIQGAESTARLLAQHHRLDGLLFTGSYQVGLELSRWYGNHPEKLLALEMGGNNPLVVHECGDLDAAAYLTIQSAYVTSGQRCTCARRLIVVDDDAGQKFLDTLVEWIGKIRVGTFEDEPEPMMGPLVTSQSAERVLETQERLLGQGAVAMVPVQQNLSCRAQVTPGLIDATQVAQRDDQECFGPLLQVVRVKDWATAVAVAQQTSYGLAAGLISDSADRYQEFQSQVRAGIINWNRQTTGASGRLPFGGVGLSGNHRPAGFFSIDYCGYPVASLEIDRLGLPETLGPGWK